MAVGVPVRDIKAVLSSVRAVLSDPMLAFHLLELCERNERAVEEYRLLLSDVARDRARLVEERKASAAAIAEERRAWDRELAQARKALAIDLDDVARRRAVVNQDREHAAALRERMERRAERVGVAHGEPLSNHADVAAELALNGGGVEGASSARSAEA
jgi:hypothetical protein